MRVPSLTFNQQNLIIINLSLNNDLLFTSFDKLVPILVLLLY